MHSTFYNLCDLGNILTDRRSLSFRARLPCQIEAARVLTVRESARIGGVERRTLDDGFHVGASAPLDNCGLRAREGGMARRVSRISLRSRLFLLVWAAVVPALFVILYTGLKHRRAEVLDAEERALSLARAVSGGHEDAIFQTRLLLSALARLPEVQGRDRAACSALFADLIRQFPRYLNFGVVGTDGFIWCSGLPM